MDDFLKDAENGNAKAMEKVARTYSLGNNGVKSDKK
eukprot:CAMPEP_0119023378 /NCGR_PEP_ID=MMETSP1176-20130426/29847_1 /TAXON_ID=265551 /ORGANISM="Synedropsis recta cf, Strain CCMP1620" /LENGTH=35 /DNA_ID= /DNA_START= /DNA_END= /DNA_ORIENTATION=